MWLFITTVASTPPTLSKKQSTPLGALSFNASSTLVYNLKKKWSKSKSSTYLQTITKVSFFVQCTKIQLDFNIQTCFSQFLWFFSLNVDLKVRLYIEFI